MSRRRFYAPRGAFKPKRQSVTLAEDEARYLREVLRLKKGDEVFVFDGEGKEFKCRIEESQRNEATLTVKEEVEPARPESRLQLTLAIALLKGEKFDLAVQKATELGVVRILPITTHYADIRLRDEADAAKRVARWNRIALEAAKQSGRARVALVSNPLSFESLNEDLDSGEARLMFSERGGRSFAEAAKTLPANPQSVTAIVGPEGGWADEELALAKEAGWPIVTLGGRILRAETAAIAVTVLLQHLFGDLK